MLGRPRRAEPSAPLSARGRSHPHKTHLLPRAPPPRELPAPPPEPRFRSFPRARASLPTPSLRRHWTHAARAPQMERFGRPTWDARRNPAPKGNGRRNDVRDRCRKPAESDEVEDDHPALRHLLIVTPRARGLRKRGPFERKFQNRPFELASPLFFFTASDLVDDERREHNAPRRAGGCFSDSTEPSCLFK